MRKIILLILLIFLSNYVSSQNHGRFWYFGQNAGLDFSTSPPTTLNDGQLNSFEGCSAISDDLGGNLLFYTDGTTVWNINHLQMPNGSGLFGDPNGSNAQVLIVKNGATTNEYFIITKEYQTTYYTIVDMSLNNNLGDIDVNRKNIVLNNNPNAITSEQMTSFFEPGNSVSWIILFDSGSFYAFRILNGAINVNNPVISNLAITSNIETRGMLKLSPDGSTLVLTGISNLDQAFLLNFDINTGAVTNPIELSSSTTTAYYYGAEFSPDSRLVYLNGNTDVSPSCGSQVINTREVFQFEINGPTGWNSNPIALGGSTGANSGRGSLQLGPDGRIYFARSCHPWLGLIVNPTIIGTGATYIDNGIALASGTFSRQGLPSFFTQQYAMNYHTIQGNIKYDFNSDGCDVADLSFSNLSIQSSGNSVLVNSISRLDGNYGVTLPDGQFTITPKPRKPNLLEFLTNQCSGKFSNPSQSIYTRLLCNRKWSERRPRSNCSSIRTSKTRF
ncbi:hypothetical protein JCM19296_3663 [Nonlabens ulvanivorans]|uniref:Uncharacterized protein n=1 Tax=Nonlabens ulvanivorans TaxID=906888 RepID=A0A081DGK8_NONUL|nr:hypothetical protein [Nonlabens ulvanivorans]GAK78054.1 hypothetical protein JCM19296_3663 [Nonlabens ulvanivorans]